MSSAPPPPLRWLVREAQRQHEVPEVWEAVLAPWVEKQIAPFTVEDALRDGLGLSHDKWDARKRQRAGRALARLGCIKTRPRSEGPRRTWCWEMVDRRERQLVRLLARLSGWSGLQSVKALQGHRPREEAMRRWIYEEQDDDEVTDDEAVEDLDDDDEDSDDDWDEDDSEEEEWDGDEDQEDEEEVQDDDEDEDLYARVDRAHRDERAKVRTSEDIAELREMRETYQEQLMEGKLPGITGVRANDLIEQIDDRITDLKARRFGGGR